VVPLPVRRTKGTEAHKGDRRTKGTGYIINE
jgi:hypothetical protein